MHDHKPMHVLDVALPMIPSRPRLRFAEGAPDGAAPMDGPGHDEDGGEQPAEQEPQEGADDSEEPDEHEEQPFDAAAAAERLRKKNSENANLRKRAKAAEDQAATNKDAAEKVPALEAENLRLRVALKHGLPEKLAKRLTGTTEEELLEDAQELLELTGNRGKKPPSDQPKERLRGGGDPTQPPTDETADTHKFAASIFDH